MHRVVNNYAGNNEMSQRYMEVNRRLRSDVMQNVCSVVLCASLLMLFSKLWFSKILSNTPVLQDKKRCKNSQHCKWQWDY